MGLFSLLGGLAAAPFTGGLSLAPTLIGAGVGAAKHFAIDKPAADRSRHLSAEITRYSPWTGMTPPAIKDASLFGSVLQGGALGNMVGGAGGIANGEAPTTLAGAANAGTSPLAAAPAMANPLAGGGGLSPMQGGSPWFNLQKASYPYSR